MSTQDHKSSKPTTIRIPYKLKMKFINEDGLHLHKRIDQYDLSSLSEITGGLASAGKIHYEVEIDLTKESYGIWRACKSWLQIAMNLKLNCKINIGKYKGLLPYSVEFSRALFTVDYIDESNENWKDWFLKEDLICIPVAY